MSKICTSVEQSTLEVNEVGSDYMAGYVAGYKAAKEGCLEPYLLGFKSGKERTIEKACEWLEENAQFYCWSEKDKNEMIEDFRKAMEDET